MTLFEIGARIASLGFGTGLIFAGVGVISWVISMGKP